MKINFYLRFDGNQFKSYDSTNYGRSYSAMVSYNGHPLIIAGYSYKRASTSETYKEENNENWGKINNIPITRSQLYSHTAAVVGDKVYTFGGYKGDMVDYLTHGLNFTTFS